MAFFSDLLKKWFYTNSSSAASSDARVPLLTATGEPKGSDTMANIASVLGVIPSVSFSMNENLNGITTSCWKSTTSSSVSSSLLNKPAGVDVGNIMLFTKRDPVSNFVLQFFFEGDKIWNRTFYNSWTSWVRIV